MNSKTKWELSPRLKWGAGRGSVLNKFMRRTGIVFLIVTLALAINAGRLIYNNTTQAATTPSPLVLGASDTANVQQDKVQFIEYKVQKGDTLFNVSQRYNISWTIVATLNKLDAPFALSPNQVIKIPKQ